MFGHLDSFQRQMAASAYLYSVTIELMEANIGDAQQISHSPREASPLWKRISCSESACYVRSQGHPLLKHVLLVQVLGHDLRMSTLALFHCLYLCTLFLIGLLSFDVCSTHAAKGIESRGRIILVRIGSLLWTTRRIEHEIVDVSKSCRRAQSPFHRLPFTLLPSMCLSWCFSNYLHSFAPLLGT